MARIGRPGLSREKKAELWERWKSGQCASDIARALERTKGAIHHVLALNGGIAPVARRRGLPGRFDRLAFGVLGFRRRVHTDRYRAKTGHPALSACRQKFVLL
jgi:hypothetical protein